jgi:hypothetical protein
MLSELTKGAGDMTKSNLKVIEGAPPEPPAEAPLSPARQALAAAIGQRPAMMGEVAAIDAARRRLSSLIATETNASAIVARLEADAATRALAWARAGEGAGPSLGDGADLVEARALFRKAELKAAAARAAEPELAREMEAALLRRAALEQRIIELVRAVLIEEASAIAASLAELERKAEAETAKLAAMRRPLIRLAGQDSMTARRSIAPIDGMIGERRTVEAEVRALEPAFQRLAEALVGDAGAVLEVA